MSAFKRYQSKVFWNQMAAQDLGKDHFADRKPSSKFYSNCDFDCPREEKEEVEEQRCSNVQENDTIDGGNVTAIRVYQNQNDSRCNASFRGTPINEEDVQNRRERGSEENAALENRSCSPLSQDLRSLDSGFSDSERSNCSEAYENETPRRRRRRKAKIKERQRKTRNRIGSLWLEDGIPPNPTYTSTPKESRVAANRNVLDFSDEIQKTPEKSVRTEDGQSDASLVPSSTSLEGESLGDFLYNTEPPEDAVESRIKSSSMATNLSEAESSNRAVLDSRNYRQSSSLRAWLSNLTTEVENECSCTLQSKSLPRKRHREIVSENVQVKDLKTLSTLATAAASKLLVRADQFDRHYRFVVNKVEHLEGGKSGKEFLRAIEDDAFLILSELGAPPPRRIQQTNLRGILSQLEAMKNYVDSSVDTRLDFYIERVVRGLEEAPKEGSGIARGALAALTALGLAGPRAGSSIARCSGVRALLTSLITASRTSEFVVASLRALASVCCSATAIDRFVKDGGPEILTDLLVMDLSPEKERMEATALVVQITAPWTDAMGLPHLEPFADSLIPALGRLVENTSCSQTLLLTAAALNHLSKSRRCALVILEHDTIRKLLKSVKKSTGGNVWLMEQVASLVGELARIPEARPHLARARASVALVSFLRMRPPGLEEAYRRLEISAAAALTRLCVDPEIARQVVAIGGADCLPSCKIDDVSANEEQVEAGLLKYTKSLRRACKKAAKQIDIARAYDSSMQD